MPPKTQAVTTFGEYLRLLMSQAGFTRLDDLAAVSGVDSTTIGRWLRDQKEPTVEKLRLVAPHLGVRLGDLMIKAGLATAAELGTVGAPPPPRAALPSQIQRIVARLLDPKISDSHKRTLLEGIDRTVRTWDEMRNPPKEPQMRKRT